MLSSELADLAGVTVRTLRHYHQIGLLPEPPRTSGDYRHYDVSHLVRLLRITRMTALGVPLSALPAVLDDPAAAEEMLDELDRQAAAQVERLVARRASIAALRRNGGPPDLPPEVSAWRSAPAAGMPADMARYEHGQLILLAHLYGDDAQVGFTALYDEAEAAAFGPLMERFYVLEPDTSDDEVASLIDDLAAYLGSVVVRLAGMPELGPRAAALVDELSEQTLKPVQHRVLRLAQQRLARPDGT